MPRGKRGTTREERRRGMMIPGFDRMNPFDWVKAGGYVDPSWLEKNGCNLSQVLHRNDSADPCRSDRVLGVRSRYEQFDGPVVLAQNDEFHPARDVGIPRCSTLELAGRRLPVLR